MSSSYTSDQDQDRVKDIQSKGTPFFYEWIIPKFNWASLEYQSQTFMPRNSECSEFRLILNREQQAQHVVRNVYMPGCIGIKVEIGLVLTKCLKIEMFGEFCIEMQSYAADKEVIMSCCNTAKRDVLEFSMMNRRCSKITQDRRSHNRNEPVVFGDTYNILTVRCTGKVLAHNRQTHDAVKTLNCKILKNIGTMLYSEMFSDVTFSVDGNEIPAHKVILGAQSPVFAAMFQHDMTENQRNLVVITDIDHQVIKEMLRFLYTGLTPSLDTMAIMAGDLLAAADKYALEELKEICEEYLLKNLSIEAACDTLRLADVHSVKLLKGKTIDYITDKSRVMEIINSSGWTEMSSTHPHVIMEAFQALAAKLQPTSPTNLQ